MEGEQLPPPARAERSFFPSLNRVARQAGLKPLDVSAIAYPSNLIVAARDMESRLQASEHCSLHIVQTGGRTLLAKRETIDTAGYFYFIPVEPLYRIMGRGRAYRSAQLLLGIFSYLYRQALVPHYMGEGYLYWEYQMLRDWCTDAQFGEQEGSEDFNYYGALLAELEEAEYFGKVVLRRISSPAHLQYLPDRIKAYRPAGKWERQCRRLAEMALQLYRDYPNHNLFTHAPEHDCHYYEDWFGLDRYVGFVAAEGTELYQRLLEDINCHLDNGCSGVDEPTLITLYDRSYCKEQQHLDFEYRLFDLMERLIDLMQNIP